MFNYLKTRIKQKYRTMKFPGGPPPDLPDRFTGYPIIKGKCVNDCSLCISACPVNAISMNTETGGPVIDTGRCIFCLDCTKICTEGLIHFSSGYSLATSSPEDLLVQEGSQYQVPKRNEVAAGIFKRSLKLRQVSAGGCNACEADTNVLSTLAWDLGRFGIQFVASPRHADGLLITGPVTENMRLALLKTYDAVPDPKIVIAVGACTISGGIYAGHPEQHNGAKDIVPVDLFIPGCPPHPLTILDGLLKFIGKVKK